MHIPPGYISCERVLGQCVAANESPVRTNAAWARMSTPKKIVVAVISCRANAGLQALSRTLWADELARNHGIETLFVSADPELKSPVEAAADGSVCFRASDAYLDLPHKVACFMDWLKGRAGAFDYVFKCDDDLYLFPERFAAFCDRLEGDYCGSVLDGPMPAASGCGYFLSARAIDAICENQDYFLAQGAEDRMVGEVMQMFQLPLTAVPEIVRSRSQWGGAYEGPNADYLGEPAYFADKIAVHLHRFEPPLIEAFHRAMASVRSG